MWVVLRYETDEPELNVTQEWILSREICGGKTNWSHSNSWLLTPSNTYITLLIDMYFRSAVIYYWHFKKRDAAATAAKSLQSCPTLCDPIDGLLPGSSVLGILQTRTLEWVAISFSNAWKWKVKVKSLSRVRLLETSWTAAYQVPPSIGFSRQEY